MNDNNSQQASPAKGFRRGRGRGAARAVVARTAIKKPTNGRRGRQKVFENNKAHAAHEQQRELKAAYSALANAIRPALEELADRNVDLLRDQTDAHQEVDEYKEIKDFLDRRLDDAVSAAQVRRNTEMALLNHENDAWKKYFEEFYKARWDEMTEEYYDAQLKRLDILEDLYNNREPVDKTDDSYDYRPITKEQIANNGIYVVYRNDGVHVPYPDVLAAEESRRTKIIRTPIKRKAGEQTEGLPLAKKTTNALTGGTSLNAPRHTGGLLSAVPPPEDPASPESKAPSPSPAEVEADYAEGEAADIADNDSPAAEQNLMPPLPNGASEPDAYGARLVNKRARAGDAPNNRIMVPQPFQWEDYEIGFRDTTNAKSRGATKAKRGKFVNQPNSGSFHFDRMVYTCDATQNKEGDLDQEIVQKHRLHPKYGLFMPDSLNVAEPSKPFVCGNKPVVFLGPEGEVLHTSRSVSTSRAEEPLKKQCLADNILDFVNQEDISPGNVQDDEIIRLVDERDQAKETRRVKLEAEEDKAVEDHNQAVAHDNFQAILDASIAVEEKPKAPSPKPAKQRRSTVSRPYDAIRDVFTTTEPAESPSPKPDTSQLNLLADTALDTPVPQPQGIRGSEGAFARQSILEPTNNIAAPQLVLDTESFPTREQASTGDQPLVQSLAPSHQAASQQADRRNTIPKFDQPSHIEPGRGQRQPSLPEQRPAHRTDRDVPLDPQLFESQTPQTHLYPETTSRRLSALEPQAPIAERDGTIDPRLYEQPQHQPRTSNSTPSFFQTALNAPQQYPAPQQFMPPAPAPTGHYPPLAPAPPREHMQPPGAPAQGPMTAPLDSSLGRNPFGNPENGDGLPPLRPHGRGSLVPPTGQVPMGPSHSGMLGPNGGTYFPVHPPPSSHEMAYSNGYLALDQGHMASLDPSVTQPGSTPVPSPYPPPPMMGGYPMSPPFHGHGHPPPQHILSPPPPPSSTYGGAQPSRRTSSISSSNSRFRKLEPAPTPPHRRGWNKNSTELRTVTYEPKESIKDYTASAPTPSHGPTQIRGWNHTASRRAREAAAAAAAAAAKAEGSPERDEHK
ncbi:hypothetical protein NKR23_g2422 [Pleurostoma richardsiae]|uniref:Uncharacterized protein n=1 Tax=Pleurostoma richardsiae TaxID=41990 RepID=A0AA38VNG1_9PEZI|nr:hypothetical protein NKR23_g2422 [Pleurostoma richardsiae]